MRALSLFSGIGGIDLAGDRAGFTLAGYSEIEPFCCHIMARHWPGVPNLGDIRELTGDAVRRACGPIDIIWGGPPCQPASCAGKRRGADDPRWLWGHLLRLVRDLRPVWVLAENPDGIVSLKPLGLDWILGQLEEAGYQPQAYCVGADDVGASHRRKRIWIVGHPNSDRRERAGVLLQPGQPRPADTHANWAGSGVGLTAGRRRGGRQDDERRGQAGGDGVEAAGADMAHAASSGRNAQPRERASTRTGNGSVAIDGSGSELADPGCDRGREQNGSSRQAVGDGRQRERGEAATEPSDACTSMADPARLSERESADKAEPGTGKQSRRGSSGRGSDMAEGLGHGPQGQHAGRTEAGTVERGYPFPFPPARNDWERWATVAELDPSLMPALERGVHSLADGLSPVLASRWRKRCLMALGNAGVPQVAEVILRAIQTVGGKGR